LDLDDFKKINDTYGHDMGDVLLKEISHRLKKAVRNSDTIARIGGDEFVALLVHADEKMGSSIAHKILEAVTGSPIMLGEFPVNIACSIGLASYPTTATNVVDLYRKADQALYAAKKQGKNQVYEASLLNAIDKS
jgi:diguanylate cyclase (GGDEF)-like protein